jgi:protocatechuate 3,4-dioxygenase beta subunit
VTGTVNDANYQGSAVGTLQIVFAPASLGDTVWLDANWDGLQNAGESGIPNVRLELATNGTAIAETRTDALGLYRFEGLLPGNYTVRVDTNTLAGALGGNPTYDPDDPALPRDHQTTVSLVAGESAGKTDFGYNWSHTNSPQGAVGDRIWVDADRNGRQDPGEPGIPGVTVELAIDTAGNGNYTSQMATAITDAAGQYIFSNLAAGAYGIRVDTNTLPPDFVQTGDPDFFGAALSLELRDHRTTAPLVLAPGGVFVNADFGYAFPQGSSIGGQIVLDLNAKGTLDSGEPGISGVTIALLDAASNAIASASTDDGGAYLFTGLPAATYAVWVGDSGNRLDRRTQTGDPDGVLDRRSTVIVDGVNAALDQDFGFAPEGQVPGLGLIGDTVFLDRDGDGGAPLPGEGLQGVTVDLYDSTGHIRLATTATDAEGQYYFGGLVPDAAYGVRVDVSTLPNGGVGLSNVVDPDTASLGNSQSTVVLAVGDSMDLDQDFGYVASVPNTIGGILWRDDNANRLIDSGENRRFAGVQVVLHLTNGNVVGSMFTGTDGVYRFTGLPDGVYRVELVDVGNAMFGFWSSPSLTVGKKGQFLAPGIAVSGGMVRTAGNFGYYLPSAALGDFVWRDTNHNGLQDAGERGLGGVLVSLAIEYPDGTRIDLQARTGNSGFYRFSNLLQDPRYVAGTTNEPAAVNQPRFTVWMDVTQPFLLGLGYTPTLINAGNGTNDSRNPAGVFVPLQQGGALVQYDFGYEGGPLLAVIGNVEAFTHDGATIVRWETVESWGTAGFWLERQVGDEWVRISQKLLPFPLFGTAPLVYEEVDPSAVAGGTYVYRLVELENDGDELTYGPYQLTVDGPGRTFADWAAANFAAEALANPAIGGRNADPDGDGLSNEQEFWAWTNPNAADSLLQISAVRQVADGVELSWQSVAGRFYKIAWAASVQGPFWPLAPEQPVLATDEITRRTLPVDCQDRQLYFRVILVGGESSR